MGIDGIGRSGGASGIPPVPPSSAGAVSGTESFSVERVGKVAKAESVTPLERLRTGEIDASTYLDLRVDQATSHLVGKVDPEKLDFIKSALRAQLEQDPMLAEMANRAISAVQRSSGE